MQWAGHPTQVGQSQHPSCLAIAIGPGWAHDQNLASQILPWDSSNWNLEGDVFLLVWQGWKVTVESISWEKQVFNKRKYYSHVKRSSYKIGSCWIPGCCSSLQGLLLPRCLHLKLWLLNSFSSVSGPPVNLPPVNLFPAPFYFCFSKFR